MFHTITDLENELPIGFHLGAPENAVVVTRRPSRSSARATSNRSTSYFIGAWVTRHLLFQRLRKFLVEAERLEDGRVGFFDG
jgi:hypothetical protein